MTAACFVGAALCPGTADPPVSALALAAAGARPSRRDALGRAPAVVFALLFAISPSVRHGAPRAVTATTPQSAWRQRGGRAYPPLLGGRSGNANSNAPERAQVQSDLASRRRNQAPSGDPFARDCLKGQQFDSYWLHHAVLENGPICMRRKTRRYPRHLGEALWANARLWRKRRPVWRRFARQSLPTETRFPVGGSTGAPESEQVN